MTGSTCDYSDLVDVYDVLVGEETCDPFDDSTEAVDVFEAGEWLSLCQHNLTDIQQTRKLAELDGQFVSRSDFKMKNLSHHVDEVSSPASALWESSRGLDPASGEVDSVEFRESIADHPDEIDAGDRQKTLSARDGPLAAFVAALEEEQHADRREAIANALGEELGVDVDDRK